MFQTNLFGVCWCPILTDWQLLNCDRELVFLQYWRHSVSIDTGYSSIIDISGPGAGVFGTVAAFCVDRRPVRRLNVDYIIQWYWGFHTVVVLESPGPGPVFSEQRRHSASIAGFPQIECRSRYTVVVLEYPDPGMGVL